MKLISKLDGMDRLQDSLAAINRATQGRALRNAVQAGLYVHEAATKQIIRDKDIIDTGNLLGSVTTAIESSTATQASGVSGTNAEYAPHNELGTEKMAARPFMRPAFDENHARMTEAVAQQFKDGINGATG